MKKCLIVNMSIFTTHFLYVKDCQMLSSYVKFTKVNKSTVKAVFAISKKSVELVLIIHVMQTQNLLGCKKDQSRVNVKNHANLDT